MEALNNVREKGQDFNLSELIKTLSDAVVFLGSANTKLVKTRKEIIKEEISPKLKGICSSEVPVSASLLFGDNFLQQLKKSY